MSQKTEAAFKEDSPMTSRLEEGENSSYPFAIGQVRKKKKKTHEEWSIQIHFLFCFVFLIGFFVFIVGL